MKKNPLSLKVGRPIILFVVTLLIFLASGTWQIDHQLPEKHSDGTVISSINDFRLIIPSLKIEAPIIEDVDGQDPDIYNRSLENGVAHLKGSSKPGEGSNIFIFGHSSFYWHKPGEYKEIFRHLEDLQKNDEIIIGHNGREYKYKVTSKTTVDPRQIDVIRPTSQEQVSLMTCVPPGTTLKRLIVVAVRTN